MLDNASDLRLARKGYLHLLNTMNMNHKNWSLTSYQVWNKQLLRTKKMSLALLMLCTDPNYGYPYGYDDGFIGGYEGEGGFEGTTTFGKESSVS